MAIFKIGDTAICKGKEVITPQGDVLITIPKGAEFPVRDISYCCYGQTIKIELQTESPVSECASCGKVRLNDGGLWLKSKDFDKPVASKKQSIALSLEPKNKEVLKQELTNAN